MRDNMFRFNYFKNNEKNPSFEEVVAKTKSAGIDMGICLENNRRIPYWKAVESTCKNENEKIIKILDHAKKVFPNDNTLFSLSVEAEKVGKQLRADAEYRNQNLDPDDIAGESLYDDGDYMLGDLNQHANDIIQRHNDEEQNYPTPGVRK